MARIIFGGDVMLGRGVGKYILRYGPDYPLQPVAGLMSDADLTVVNLECALTSSEHRWPGMPKAFYFGAPPQAAECLTKAGVDLVSLANNHVLDFGTEGLRETLDDLRRHHIQFAGAGEDIRQASAPAIIERGGIRFGMAAFCDHQLDFAAKKNHPGIAYIDFDDEFAAVAMLRRALAPLQHARVDWPILSLHWGPNMALRPSMKFRRLAHAAIGMGWKILFGHSAHVFQGIEIHHGCPIVYAAGDLVDDYQVDPEFKNDHQLLIEIELSRDALKRIQFHPVLIENCQAREASGEEYDYIAQWLIVACQEMGTRVRREDGAIRIDEAEFELSGLRH